MARKRKPSSRSSRAPAVASLAGRLDELTRPLDALGAQPAPPTPLAARSDDLELAEQLAARQGAPYEHGDRRGAIAYGGALDIAGREVLWQVERPLPGLLELDPAGPAAVLATLGHPHRLRLLLSLIERPRTAAELQKAIGSKSPGPLYHHLNDLLALGIVIQRERRYQVPARHVVPLLAALAITIDLGARPAS